MAREVKVIKGTVTDTSTLYTVPAGRVAKVTLQDMYMNVGAGGVSYSYISFGGVIPFGSYQCQIGHILRQEQLIYDDTTYNTVVPVSTSAADDTFIMSRSYEIAWFHRNLLNQNYIVRENVSSSIYPPILQNGGTLNDVIMRKHRYLNSGDTIQFVKAANTTSTRFDYEFLIVEEY